MLGGNRSTGSPFVSLLYPISGALSIVSRDNCMRGRCPHRPETDGRDSFNETRTLNDWSSRGDVPQSSPYEYLQNVHSHEERPLPLAFCRKLCYADCGATSSTPVGGSPGFLFGGDTYLFAPLIRKGVTRLWFHGVNCFNSAWSFWLSLLWFSRITKRSNRHSSKITVTSL